MKIRIRRCLAILFQIVAIALLRCQKTMAATTSRQTGINVQTMLRGQNYVVMGIIFVLAVMVILVDFIYFSRR